MDRYPFIITGGGMLLGWIAGTMAVTDPGVAQWVPMQAAEAAGKAATVAPAVYYGAAIGGALFVLAVGKWFASRRQAEVTT